MKSTYVGSAFSTSTHSLTFLLPWDSLATISTTHSHNFLYVWAGGHWTRLRAGGRDHAELVLRADPGLWKEASSEDQTGRGRGKLAQDRAGSKDERSPSRDPRTGQRGSGACVKTKPRTSKQSETWARTDAHQVPFSLRPGKPYDRCRG